MKTILANIIKKSYNTLSSFGVFAKRALYSFAGLFRYKRKRQSSNKVLVTKNLQGNFNSSTNMAKSTHRSYKSSSSKKLWWKNKIFIIGASAALVACAVVVVVLSANGGGDASYVSDANKGGQSAAKSENSQEISGTSDNVSISQNEIDAANDTSVQTIQTTPPEGTPIPTTQAVEEDLIPGRHDSRIIQIQMRLMELGYMDHDEPSDYYGYGTEYALQLFQRKHGLQVDGILGDRTIDMLFSDDAILYTVKIGDSGTDIASLQKRLQTLNYLSAGSTGYFGTDTEAAVKSFQSRNGLYADGNVGEQTREALYSADARAASTSSGGSSGGTSTGNLPVVVGDPDDASADALIAFALTQLGKPYVRGGKGPSSFDCSGFVYYCLNSVGYKIRYMTSTTWRSADFPTINNMSDIKKGDILCFSGHVGIYMGNGKMVDASSSNGKIVVRTNIFASNYWTSYFKCAKRIF